MLGKMTFDSAVEYALGQAMAEDERIIIMGEDVASLRANLSTRFGRDRVLSTPISEAAFTGAGITAAMAGLRPVVEIMLVDFIAVALDAVINHAAKISTFSGNKWNVPLVIRTTCGGGYGDGGQHEQSLWGLLAHIPGLKVVVPATPADAAGLMLSSLADEDPVIFLEHKLLSDSWLDYMGYGGRKTVHFDVPEAGRFGKVPGTIKPIPLGKGEIRVTGNDVSLISTGVGMHRCMEAAHLLADQGIHAEVIDLRTIQPIDKNMIISSVAKTSRLVVVDEDYQEFGLSGEVAAICLEAGLHFSYTRVCTAGTIPYARNLESKILPGVESIIQAAKQVLSEKSNKHNNNRTENAN